MEKIAETKPNQTQKLNYLLDQLEKRKLETSTTRLSGSLINKNKSEIDDFIIKVVSVVSSLEARQKSRLTGSLMNVNKDGEYQDLVIQVENFLGIAEKESRIGKENEVDKEKIQQSYRQCLDYIKNAQEIGMDLSSFFSGGNVMSTAKPIFNGRILPKYASAIQLGSFASTIDTGADYEDLYKQPLDRFKFYHSFNSEASAENIESYLNEIYENCKKEGVSLQTKTEDHDYDCCNFYTWDFQKLEQIIQKVYPKYVKEPFKIFSPCQRVFQGSIKGVSPNHIAIAQEPAKITLSKEKNKSDQELVFAKFGEKFGEGNSHSNRMGKLGKEIKNILASKSNLSKDDYIQACQKTGVRADRPWLWDLENLD